MDTTDLKPEWVETMVDLDEVLNRTVQTAKEMTREIKELRAKGDRESKKKAKRIELAKNKLLKPFRQIRTGNVPRERLGLTHL